MSSVKEQLVFYSVSPDAARQHTGVLTVRDLPCERSLKEVPPAQEFTGTPTRVGPILASRRESDPEYEGGTHENVPWPAEKMIRRWRLIGRRYGKKRVRMGLRDREEPLGCVFYLFRYCGKIYVKY
ncbi:hypothetical protein EVAR_59195_1 [Eumeta japonica]|uniref:Uncharacterized protein n=1 Tax=Eumeta variegata TaxID=151549 RepID=A0A4C1ZCX5_EUMVA|nr:hypothetical protein EVAR_59195_1 [Eumeta japonica]